MVLLLSQNFYWIKSSFCLSEYIIIDWLTGLIYHFHFQSPPYSMFKESTEKLVGNDAFEGYAIDLISEIARILRKCPFWRQLTVLVWLLLSDPGFNYTFKWVDDGAYGYKNKETGEWNGLMGELLSQVSGAREIFSGYCLAQSIYIYWLLTGSRICTTM